MKSISKVFYLMVCLSLGLSACIAPITQKSPALPDFGEPLSEIPASIKSAIPEGKGIQCPHTGQQFLRLELDGAGIGLCSDFKPGDLTLSSQKDIVQMTTTSETADAPSITLLAIPYGVQPSTEELPAAQKGISPAYLQKISEYRLNQKDDVYKNRTISFLGQKTDGIVSISESDKGGYIMIAEWVAEAGERAWLLRAEKTFANKPDSDSISNLLTQYFGRLSIINIDVEQPSASKALIENPNPKISKEIASAGDLPYPLWWNGDCNVNNHRGSYYLGNSYQGVKACGPVGTERGVNFYAGVSQLEWQCPEITKRYLYMAYGIVPFSANGRDVVKNYPGTILTKIYNQTVGVAPQPGDVMSYGPTTLYGHTALVTESHVDENGNGYITILEQNYSSSGKRTNAVTNWYVKDVLKVIGWLHDPNNGKVCYGPIQNKPLNNYVSPSQSLNFSWMDPGYCSYSQYQFRVKDTPDMESGGNVIFEKSVTDPFITASIGKEWHNKDLYWGVRATAPATPNWLVRKFKIQPDGNHANAPSVPAPASPADGESFSGIPKLCWNKSTDPDNDAVSYQVTVSGSTGFQSPWITDTCIIPTGLADGSYKWSVRSSDNYGNTSSASAARNFKIETKRENQPPTAPILASPADGGQHFATPQLCWEESSDPDNDLLTYQVHILGASSYQSDWLTETCFTTDSLPSGSYSWYVTARDGEGLAGDSSLQWNFVVEDDQVSLYADPATITAGEDIYVVWSRTNASGEDWIGVYGLDDPDSSIPAAVTLDGASGVQMFRIDNPGIFHFRYFRNGEKIATSNAVEVVEKSVPWSEFPMLYQIYSLIEEIYNWVNSQLATVFIKELLAEFAY